MKTKLQEKLNAVPFWAVVALALIAALFCATFSSVTRSYYDSDSYFILTTGRYICENGLPKTNPFVIHDGLKMPVHQWLYDVIVYQASRAGTAGLFLLALFLFLLLGTLLYRYARLFVREKLPALVLSVLVLFAVHPWLTLRPTFLTVSLILGMQIALIRWRESRKTAWLVLPVLLCLLLVNVHTSLFIMAPILMLPQLLPEHFLPRKGFKEAFRAYVRDSLPLFCCFLLCLLAGLCNPYGLTGMFYPLLSYGIVTDLSIQELARPAVLSYDGFFLITVLLLFASYLRKTGLRRMDLRLVSLWAGTFFLGIMHMRNCWFLLFAAVPLAVPLTDKLREIRLPSPEKERPKAAFFLRLEVIFFALAAMGITLSQARISNSAVAALTPAGAADCLDEKDPGSIVLFTGFNTGAYMEYRGYKGYMDARPEIYSLRLNGRKDVLAEYGSLVDGSADYAAFLEEYGFTHLILDRHEKCFAVYLETCGAYRKIWSDEYSALYEKTSE